MKSGNKIARGFLDEERLFIGGNWPGDAHSDITDGNMESLNNRSFNL